MTKLFEVIVSVQILDLQRKSTVFETLLTVIKCKLEPAQEIFPYRFRIKGDLNPQTNWSRNLRDRRNKKLDSQERGTQLNLVSVRVFVIF
jgi:hypothetical protein